MEQTMSNFQIEMFGTTTDEIDAKLAEDGDNDLSLIISTMSILSDSQVQSQMGANEKSRQSINVAKYILSKLMVNVRNSEKELI